MIHTDIFHYTGENTGKFIRSHKLQPSDSISIFCILYGEKDNVVSVLEDHLLEAISGIEWSSESLDTDFSFISENFNHFVHNIDEDDMQSTGILLAVIMEQYLVFAHTGDTSVILLEKDGSITPLSNSDHTGYLFSAISSGEVTPGSHVYLSSTPLEGRISDDLIRELSDLNSLEWNNIIEDIFKREVQESIHVGHISHTVESRDTISSRKSTQSDIIRNTAKEVLSQFHLTHKLGSLRESLLHILHKHTQETKYILLTSGIIILFALIYFLFSAIFSVVSSPERDTKNQLIQAKTLIENSQKLVNNPQSFNQSIEDAEKILFELRDKRLHMSDTQSLLSRIEAMKKEVNDIQTIDVSKLPIIMNFEGQDISPRGVSEFNKKLNLFGKNQSFLSYARGESLPKANGYPTGEQAKSIDYSDDGSFYILTEQNHVLSMRGSDISTVTTNGKNEWSVSRTIATFNGNIYLLGSGSESILRYKPGINGFSTPTTILDNLGGKIVDIGIDGGIYALLENGKVVRYIGGTSGGQKNLNINKVPGEYDLGSEEQTQIFVRPNLSYVYILSGRNIWIFAPDSKRFQDVTAWNYVAQLELQSTDEIASISVPRDGIIYIVNSSSVRELGFEIADGKIILR